LRRPAAAALLLAGLLAALFLWAERLPGGQTGIGQAAPAFAPPPVIYGVTSTNLVSFAPAAGGWDVWFEDFRPQGADFDDLVVRVEVLSSRP
jgi:hypothetical protein